MLGKLEVRPNVEHDYADVFTPEARAALEALCPFNGRRLALMDARTRRRARRMRDRERISFLDPGSIVAGTAI
jgi:hypothetical protein